MKQILLSHIALFGILTICRSQANTSLSNLASPTAVNVTLLPNVTKARDLGSSVFGWKNLYLTGDHYLDGIKYLHNKGNANTFMGALSGNAITTGFQNVAVGYRALYRDTSGASNTALGFEALVANSNGNYNTATGNSALRANTIGSYNTASGLQALYKNINGNHNVASGYQALYANTNGYYNTANGNLALYNSNSNNNTANGYAALYSNRSGTDNTASGFQALFSNNAGNFNTATGASSLYSNTTGFDNTASGSGALYYNTSGSANTASGSDALKFNKTGNSNTALGAGALRSDEGGQYNTATGFQSLYSNHGIYDAELSNGSYNTSTGTLALYSNNTGSSNTALGFAALYNNTSGIYNTAVGSHANVSSGNLYNSSAFGYSTYVSASNQVRIGNNLVTSIGGQVGWTTLSDGRVKKNIKTNVPGLTFINKLQAVTYNLNLDAADKIIQRPSIKTPDGKTMQLSNEEMGERKLKEQIIYTGFIAQDVEKVAKEIGYDFNGVDAAKNDKDLYGLRYAEFVVPLVKAVQELSEKNDEKDKRIAALEDRLIKLESLLPGNHIISAADGYLRQNVPNPFDKSTTIPFHIPAGSKSASLVIIQSGSGKIVKTIPVSTTASQFTLTPGTLAAGIYTYSLMADGNMVGTRQMIIAR